MAPRARFELATLRLTAECSTVELPGNGQVGFQFTTTCRLVPLSSLNLGLAWGQQWFQLAHFRRMTRAQQLRVVFDHPFRRTPAPVTTASLFLIYSRAMLFGAAPPDLKSTRQLTCDFLAHIASPDKTFDRPVATVENQRMELERFIL